MWFLSFSLCPHPVDSCCSSPSAINSGVPQRSVLSPTLFLLFINYLLNCTSCPVYLYADILHFPLFHTIELSTHRTEVTESWENALAYLTSFLSLISNWVRKSVVIFNTAKTHFLHISVQYSLSNNYSHHLKRYTH